jgi:hypothetical protein
MQTGMRRGRVVLFGIPSLFVVAVATGAIGCGSDEEQISPGSSGGAAGADASAGTGGGGASGLGGGGGAGGMDATTIDVGADVNWSAMCSGAVPAGPGSCRWACGCDRCAKVTAECLSNDACKAIIDCTIAQGCSNDPDAGANACQVKCASVIKDNYTAGGLRASAFDQCAATSCALACLPDTGVPDGPSVPDAPTDARSDAPADAVTVDAAADGPAEAAPAEAAPDAPPDVAEADAPAEAAAIDAPAEASAPDAPAADGGDASVD